MTETEDQGRGKRESGDLEENGVQGAAEVPASAKTRRRELPTDTWHRDDS